jgi:hypothetical protein
LDIAVAVGTDVWVGEAIAVSVGAAVAVEVAATVAVGLAVAVAVAVDVGFADELPMGIEVAVGADTTVVTVNVPCACTTPEITAASVWGPAAVVGTTNDVEN